MYKSFETIADNITEEEYRSDGAMHYSTLATYARGGFGAIQTLFEKKESLSLTFGSCVDAIITGGMEEFNSKFLVAEFPPLEPSYISVIKEIFNIYKDSYNHLFLIPESYIIPITERVGFYKNWKPETRARVIKEKCSEYYDLLLLADSKTLIDTTLYNKVIATVDALKTSTATKWYFEDNNPFDNSIERFYQLKFHAKWNNIPYSCMADLIVVDNVNKKVYPCDLKTSSHKEYDFYKSFIDWSYSIQSRLYWRLIRASMDADPVFKEYDLEDYTFIVVNGETLNPLTWKYEDTQKDGTLYYGKNKQIECRDPFNLGEELNMYLNSQSIVPNGISLENPNSLTNWLNTL